MTSSTDPLLEEAYVFAQQLSSTISAFTGQDCVFAALVIGDLVQVAEETGHGVALTVDGVTHLSLIVEMKCKWDSAGRYLAVEKSTFAVHAGSSTNKEPLFRYDYVRQPKAPIPCAHLQVHAHRDAFTHALSSAGRNSRRGKSMSKRTPDKHPQLSDFHFPLGGPRFRPCLQDLIAALQDEFGLDAADGWHDALAEGRATWRRQQVGAAVRDAPQEAVRVLTELGYSVTGPQVPERLDRLEQL
ncbi:MAG: hypothetical protein U0R67_12665 [Micropruina glycogenica]